jgi:hypothetical protein
MDQSQFVVGQLVVSIDGFRVPYIPAGTTGEITQLYPREAWVQFPGGRVRVPYFSLEPAPTLRSPNL